MPEMMVTISVKHLVEIIRILPSQELETLDLLLTKEGKELIKRWGEVEHNTIRLLTREEIFDI